MNTSQVQQERLKKLCDNPRDVLIIHWARQNFEDNQGGFSTPRIIAIMVRSLDGSTSKTFAIHLEAEKIGFTSEDIADYYDQVEEQILIDFNEFVKDYSACTWIYWDDDPHFGFEFVKHRYSVLVDIEHQDLTEIPIQNKLNLSACLKEIYGLNYEDEPQFDNLMKSNNDGQLKYGLLSINEEARLFKNSKFPDILQSLKCKVDFLIEVMRKVSDKTLKVSNKSFLYRLEKFFTHPIMIAIAWVCAVISVVLALVLAALS